MSRFSAAVWSCLYNNPLAQLGTPSRQPEQYYSSNGTQQLHGLSRKSLSRGVAVFEQRGQNGEMR
jgi:hypothetical protein